MVVIHQNSEFNLDCPQSFHVHHMFTNTNFSRNIRYRNYIPKNVCVPTFLLQIMPKSIISFYYIEWKPNFLSFNLHCLPPLFFLPFHNHLIKKEIRIIFNHPHKILDIYSKKYIIGTKSCRETTRRTYQSLCAGIRDENLEEGRNSIWIIFSFPFYHLQSLFQVRKRFSRKMTKIQKIKCLKSWISYGSVHTKHSRDTYSSQRESACIYLSNNLSRSDI